ncbi:mannose-6-phosphate isomerase [Mangrovimonas yunxiaonensis]|uniref:Phosphohexomutase n=1 Tax=Mangrovimonas yunxiaonensis TaxID=1197477 RepID=A0A084TNQ1_9FLAO|nr:type I phosphomannose isomerase catalytic subunit [Mangrovimonas yunxiaonensis]KFB02337.1 mannose-6-phosphate isomerase [Mangrovimonas yunxiaonensis]GGH39734.1 mannose-6-phosphate isomerase [Mangrovimonas yunxiaonensis]
MKDVLYPIKFHPILKEKIWGGQKLKQLLDKESSLPNVGESWEISDVEGDCSIVANGMLKGTTLNELLKTYKAKLIGEKNYKVFNDKFPLLIKFIDANKDLSIQLHPNDTLAKKRHDSFGKTEMWYVMQADEDANLIIGFNQDLNLETYLKHQKNKTLPSILNFEKVKSGDTFFIDGGRVHAIGAGTMLAEIQQTSDITYRIYDWDRVDANGHARELHNDLVIDAIDFNMPNNFKVSYGKTKNKANKMVACSYFTTNYLEVEGLLHKENHNDSFLIYICVEGKAEILTEEKTVAVKAGETVLLPAALKTFKIKAEKAKLLEVYI